MWDRGDDSVDTLVVQSEDRSAERGGSGGGISTETETKAELKGGLALAEVATTQC